MFCQINNGKYIIMVLITLEIIDSTDVDGNSAAMLYIRSIMYNVQLLRVHLCVYIFDCVFITCANRVSTIYTFILLMTKFKPDSLMETKN